MTVPLYSLSTEEREYLRRGQYKIDAPFNQQSFYKPSDFKKEDDECMVTRVRSLDGEVCSPEQEESWKRFPKNRRNICLVSPSRNDIISACSNSLKSLMITCHVWDPLIWLYLECAAASTLESLEINITTFLNKQRFFPLDFQAARFQNLRTFRLNINKVCSKRPFLQELDMGPIREFANLSHLQLAITPRIDVVNVNPLTQMEKLIFLKLNIGIVDNKEMVLFNDRLSKLCLYSNDNDYLDLEYFGPFPSTLTDLAILSLKYDVTYLKKLLHDVPECNIYLRQDCHEDEDFQERFETVSLLKPHTVYFVNYKPIVCVHSCKKERTEKYDCKSCCFYCGKCELHKETGILVNQYESIFEPNIWLNSKNCQHFPNMDFINVK